MNQKLGLSMKRFEKKKRKISEDQLYLVISELTNTDCFAGNHGGNTKGVGPLKPHLPAREQREERTRSQEGRARGEDGFM